MLMIAPAHLDGLDGQGQLHCHSTIIYPAVQVGSCLAADATCTRCASSVVGPCAVPARFGFQTGSMFQFRHGWP